MADDTSSQARSLRFGEAMAHVQAVSNRNPQFALGSLGGRFVLLCVIADVSAPTAKAAIQALASVGFNDGARLCAVFCTDPNAAENALAPLGPERLIFSDPAIGREAGLVDPLKPEGRWVLLDPTLRVYGAWPLADAAAALAALSHTPPPGEHAGAPINAPVLIAPRVFEPELCKQLIAYYDRGDAKPSGVTQSRPDGATFVALANDFKRRSDVMVDDKQMREAIMHRIFWRLAPEIEKAFMWRPTRMERYLVACYEAEGGGFFKPHRDNTTKGTAHRRFAVTINLNAGAYEGGDLRFPEFGPQTYRAPTGGAVVFSCSLLHEATPVTRGKRYAFLPFLYDEAAAKMREENDKYLDETIQPYRKK